MSPSPLSRPVSALVRASYTVDAEQTLGAVAFKLRENSAGLLPVVSGFTLKGVVSEGSLAEALARGCEDTEGVEAAFLPEPPVIKMYETGAEALRAMESFRIGALVVVDDDWQVAGLLRASDLVWPPSFTQRPAMIGGMATPFGVYLTSGTVSAGAKGWALVSTGALLLSILFLASLPVYPLYDYLVHQRGLAIGAADQVTTFLQLLIFAAAFRLLPISGTHAAEHMVVHAIEKGEPLVPHVVKRMPRVHPRCGTNLAVGVMLFITTGEALSRFVSDRSLPWLISLIITLLLWRPLGALVQFWITTRPPSDKQIEMGIRSAKELLDKQGQSRHLRVGLPMRLWNSGLFHVMAGSLLVSTLLWGLSALFGWQLSV